MYRIQAVQSTYQLLYLPLVAGHRADTSSCISVSWSLMDGIKESAIVPRLF
jgi:hypothetical protein